MKVCCLRCTLKNRYVYYTRFLECVHIVGTNCIDKLARQNRFPSFRGELFLFPEFFCTDSFPVCGAHTESAAAVAHANEMYRTNYQELKGASDEVIVLFHLLTKRYKNVLELVKLVCYYEFVPFTNYTVQKGD